MRLFSIILMLIATLFVGCSSAKKEKLSVKSNNDQLGSKNLFKPLAENKAEVVEPKQQEEPVAQKPHFTFQKTTEGKIRVTCFYPLVVNYSKHGFSVSVIGKYSQVTKNPMETVKLSQKQRDVFKANARANAKELARAEAAKKYRELLSYNENAVDAQHASYEKKQVVEQPVRHIIVKTSAPKEVLVANNEPVERQQNEVAILDDPLLESVKKQGQLNKEREAHEGDSSFDVNGNVRIQNKFSEQGHDTQGTIKADINAKSGGIALEWKNLVNHSLQKSTTQFASDADLSITTDFAGGELKINGGAGVFGSVGGETEGFVPTTHGGLTYSRGKGEFKEGDEVGTRNFYQSKIQVENFHMIGRKTVPLPDAFKVNGQENYGSKYNSESKFEHANNDDEKVFEKITVTAGTSGNLDQGVNVFKGYEKSFIEMAVVFRAAEKLKLSGGLGLKHEANGGFSLISKAGVKLTDVPVAIDASYEGALEDFAQNTAKVVLTFGELDANGQPKQTVANGFFASYEFTVENFDFANGTHGLVVAQSLGDMFYEGSKTVIQAELKTQSFTAFDLNVKAIHQINDTFSIDAGVETFNNFESSAATIGANAKW